MIAPEVLGQEGARTLLARVLGSGRIPHALLFQGPEGTGKRLVAERFAAALLCESGATDACGSCGTCRKVAHGNHPDLFRIERLPKDEKHGAAFAVPESLDTGDEESGGGSDELRPFIVIEQIRWLNEHSAYAPREGRRRIFIIDPADRMTAASQNALLKTLEEPAGASILILIAARPHTLLPTVRSRCLAVRFGPVSPAALARGLEARGSAPEDAMARAALSGGRPGLAIALDLAALRRRREEILSALESLAADPSGLARLPEMADAVAGDKEDDLLERLEVVEGLLRDAARAAVAPEGLLHADLADRLEALGRRIAPSRAAELVAAVERLRGLLRIHVNRTLVAEALLSAVAGGPIPR